ncbi:hypothetical protein LJC64_03000 [Ruminococcaceae bacterium OttesenSCG-928-A11]|nr:hypothetical protein [Ruminococcaceae bacterium OttesenSCG-928-A11]
MSDYKRMYHKLFNAITSTIELLQCVQMETEALYVDSDETPLRLSDGKKEDLEE